MKQFVTPAAVHVDLSNKSCTITEGDVQHGQWSGVTRRSVERAIACDGWAFAPGSEWTLTPDGGIREVIQDPAVHADDRLLDQLGAAKPYQQSLFVQNELNALLLSWRHNVDTQPPSELVDTDTALTVIQGRAA